MIIKAGDAGACWLQVYDLETGQPIDAVHTVDVEAGWADHYVKIEGRTRPSERRTGRLELVIAADAPDWVAEQYPTARRA